MLKQTIFSAAAQNFGWLIAERAVRLVLVTGVGFFVARHLGPEELGALSTALALVGLTFPLAEMGLEAVTRRELIRSPELAADLVGTVRGLRFVGAFVALIVLGIAITSPWMSTEERRLVFVLAITVFQPTFWIADTWFQSRLLAKVTVSVQLMGLMVGAMCRVFLILREASLIAFAWTAAGEFILMAGLLSIAAHRSGLRYGRFSRAIATRLVGAAWPLFLSGVAVILYMRSDLVMLRALAGKEAAGLYAAAIRFTEVWYFVPGALAASLLPGLLAAREHSAAVYTARVQQYYDLNTILAYALSIPIVFGAPWLIAWAYGPQFTDAARVIAWHASSLIFIFINVARGQFFVNEGLARLHLVGTIAGLGMNIGLNLWLIPNHGAVGAAIATFIAQAASGWVPMFFSATARSNMRVQMRALFIWIRWPEYFFRS